MGGGPGHSRVPSKGADLTHVLPVSLEEAYRGTEKTVLVSRGSQREEIRVKIPAGVTPGQKLRVAGKGRPHQGGGRSGDLIIRVEMKPHDLFSRVEDDVYIGKTISFSQAALGTVVPVETLEGETKRVRIPRAPREAPRSESRDTASQSVTSQAGETSISVLPSKSLKNQPRSRSS